MKRAASILGLLVVAPIWYWLIYQILVRVDATELMFFLFWVHVPVGVLVKAMTELAEADK